MILNAYGVLDAFIVLLRLLVSVLVVGLGLSAWWQLRRWLSPDRRAATEDRCYLLFSLAFLLVTLNFASWPILYLLLQSYVPEWPGVMCIYGVTRIGAGSMGVSRHLPTLLTALQLTKPALFFLSGAWWVLYLVNRRTQTAPLMKRSLTVLIAAGLLAGADCAAEAAYLAIPKKEEFLSTGCCTTAFEGASSVSKFLPQAMLAEHWRPWLYSAYYVVNLGMVLILLGYTASPRVRPTAKRLFPVLFGTLISLPLGIVFLTEIAAPLVLHLPYHHCVYDLIPQAPETVVGIALFALGSCSVGWACVAGWLGRCSETAPFLHETVRGWCAFAMFGYLGSVIMMSIELALA